MSNDSIERFNFYKPYCSNQFGEDCGADMQRAAVGEYVRYSDHQHIVKELEARIEKLMWEKDKRCQHWDDPPSGTAIELLDKVGHALSTITSPMSAKDCGEVWKWFWQLDERLRRLASHSLSDAIKEVEKAKLPPSRRFLVRFVDHVQGTNSATWECKKCKGQWVSPANMECPYCHDNEAEPKVTEADAIYNQAIDDTVERLKSLGT